MFANICIYEGRNKILACKKVYIDWFIFDENKGVTLEWILRFAPANSLDKCQIISFAFFFNLNIVFLFVNMVIKINNRVYELRTTMPTFNHFMMDTFV